MTDNFESLVSPVEHFARLELEKLQFGAVTYAMAEVRELDEWMGERLAYSLHAFIYGYRLAKDVQAFSYTKTKQVELPQPWWRRLLRRPVRTMDVTISGEVKVAATAFDLFPQDRMSYPPTLGKPVYFVRMEPHV